MVGAVARGCETGRYGRRGDGRQEGGTVIGRDLYDPMANASLLPLYMTVSPPARVVTLRSRPACCMPQPFH